MNLLADLAGGLRNAAGVLNPEVQRDTFRADERQQEIRQQRQQMLVMHVAQQVQSGAMTPEEGRALMTRFGAPPELAGGPGVDVQQKQAAAAKEVQYQAAIKALGPNPTQEQLAEVGAQFSDAKTLLTSQTASLDRRDKIVSEERARKEKLDADMTARRDKLTQDMELAKQRGADRLELQRISQEGRKEIAMLAASLRQPRQERMVPVEQADGSIVYTPQSQAAGEKVPKKGGGSDGGVSPEGAGKVSMADQAILDLRGARAALFDKDGDLNRTLIAAINVPFTAGLPFNEEARSTYSKLYNAMEAKLRIETGAAATEREVKSILNRFLPKVTDPKGVVKERLDRLEEFFDTTIDQTKGVKKDAIRSRQTTAPKVNSPTGPFGDAEKERRYQEWRKANP